MDRERLKAQLVCHEGFRAFPYRDSVGKLTIGVGRNLDDVGISHLEADVLLENDIDKAVRAVNARFAFFADLDPVRQAVLVNMAFNLGATKLAEFQNTLRAIGEGRYLQAAEGMLASKWARQVGKRAQELAEQMRTGTWGDQ